MFGLKTPLFPYKSAQAIADDREARALKTWLAARPQASKRSWPAVPAGYAADGTPEPDVRGPAED